jgi:ABC-type amino acid transport substrate-binding protein
MSTSEQEADMAFTGITVTKERKKLVEFTTPFMYSGVAILYLVR